jgi:hypothetical protein
MERTMAQPEAIIFNDTPEIQLGYLALHCVEDVLLETEETVAPIAQTLFEQSAQVETIMPSAAMTYKIITVRSDLPDGGFKLDDIELSKEDD